MTMLNSLISTREIPNALGIFFVVFLVATLYIHWDQFISVHVSISIPSHWVTFNVVLVFKRLNLNLLNILILLTLKVVLGSHPYQTQNNLKYFKTEVVKVFPKINIYIVVPTICSLSKTISLRIFIKILIIYNF